MEKYLIYYNESETSKKYVETIYRNSISVDTDMGDAIEFQDKQTALLVKDYLCTRDNKKYKVLCIKTSMEDIDE